MIHKRLLWLVACIISSESLSAAEAIIPASKDNTLYEDAGGVISNGSGDYLFVGRVGPNGGGAIRRTVVAFDVAGSVPAGATITNAVLKLNMNLTIAGSTDVALHKLAADWGEGTSHAPGEEGGGAAAASSDATWTKRFFGTADDWATPGGDFAATASATTPVSVVGPYTWTSATMISDVVSWHSAPATNFGWILIGDESTETTAKRFVSKDNPTTANRPSLTITYSPASNVGNWSIY